MVFILFWVVVGWALYDGEMYAKEAAIWILIWAACLGAFLFIPGAFGVAVAVMAVADIILIYKQFGNPQIN